MTQAVTRRVFLGAAVGIGVLAGPIAGSARADVRTVYRLNPNWGTGDASCDVNAPVGSCSGCNACVSHAKNKRFATRVAADAGRAHSGCKCAVEVACAVSTGTHALLFAQSSSVDLRTPGVGEQIVCVPAQPNVHPPGEGTGSPGTKGAPLGATLGAPAPSIFAATGAATAPATSPTGFALTGAPIATAATIGAAGVAIGAALLRLRRRNDPVMADVEPNLPE